MMRFGVWSWNPVFEKTSDEEPLYMAVEPCELTQAHGVHIHSYGDEKTSHVVVCHGIKPPLPTSYIMCQFMNPDIRNHLPCKMREGDGVTGYQCERLDAHGDDGHWFSEHLIRHDRGGNGYSCEEIERL